MLHILKLACQIPNLWPVTYTQVGLSNTKSLACYNIKKKKKQKIGPSKFSANLGPVAGSLNSRQDNLQLALLLRTLSFTMFQELCDSAAGRLNGSRPKNPRCRIGIECVTP